jgi:hypothetical protein
VVLLVLAAMGGLIAGRVRPAVGGHVARPHLRRLELVLVGIGLAIVASLVHGDLGVLCDALSIAVLAAFAGVNRNLTGVAVVGVGLVLNLGAVVLNNGMPVRGEALVRAHVVRADELGSHDEPPPRHLETDADAFAWLGSIVPVRAAHEVLSFGDLIVLAGLVDAARDLGRRRGRLPEVEDDDALWPLDGGDGGQAGGVPPTTAASVDHDWGAAPKGSAESGSQCSAKPDISAADVTEFWKDAALPPSPAHLAARQDR